MSNNIRREVAPDWRIVTECLNIEAHCQIHPVEPIMEVIFL
ncbi:12592_t:CDS:2 [Funneliformis caledonium]|uniref:12592_t:CDS:1 n=1 Tax=Funneliformis caledonium TaxID=1117310 RepID=A0A9N9GIL4_9GLOM|nr:12592_t:CDS:2 [Funneliformis caledonium]